MHSWPTNRCGASEGVSAAEAERGTGTGAGHGIGEEIVSTHYGLHTIASSPSADCRICIGWMLVTIGSGGRRRSRSPRNNHRHSNNNTNEKATDPHDPGD